MLFIVVGHTNIRTPIHPGASPILSVFSALTLSSGVPLFFCLAGYFAKPCLSWFNWKRARDIFVSMLFWCIVGYFWFGVLNQLESGQSVDVAALLNTRIWGILGTWDSVGTPGSCDCWFLKVLIPLVLVSGALIRMKSCFLCGVIVTAAVFGLAEHDIPGVPYCLTRSSLNGLSWFALGIVIRRYLSISQISEWVGKICAWFVVLTFVLAVLNFTWQPLICSRSFLGILWGMVYLLCLAKLLCSKLPTFSRWFASFGTGVFFIYMVQEMLVIQCRWYFSEHPINKHVYALVPFVIFGVLMLTYSVIRRYLPWCCGVVCLAPVKRLK